MKKNILHGQSLEVKSCKFILTKYTKQHHEQKKKKHKNRKAGVSTRFSNKYNL